MSRRTQRVSELLREELSELIQKELKDPRLDCLISITEVVVSIDLHYAKVYVSVMASTEEERANAMDALKTANRFLHRELTHRLAMRSVPELTFMRDDSIERGVRLTQLINEVTKGTKQDEGN